MQTDRLHEIREEIHTLLEEAENLIRIGAPNEYSAAKSYWLAHIECALGSEQYPTYSLTMMETITTIEECADS